MSTPMPPRRIIWAYAAGYFLSYMVYASVVKLVTTGVSAPSGLEILPATVAGIVCGSLTGLTLLGWWRYARVVREPLRLVSAAAAALIIATTTLAYSFAGFSIVLVLLLLRGGVLILAPLVDLATRRRVRWFCWAALALSMAAVTLALARLGDYAVLTAASIINIGLYLCGYVVRIPTMTKLAKVHDPELTRRYFVDELLVALVLLVAVPLAIAVLPFGEVSAGLQRGIALSWRAPFFTPAFLAGIFYAVLYFFGTHIYLDRRENTFCIPLNRCTSLLSGVVGMYVLSWMGKGPSPAGAQLVAAGLICIALLLLSPAHHLAEVMREARTRGVMLPVSGEPEVTPALAPCETLEETV